GLPQPLHAPPQPSSSPSRISNARRRAPHAAHRASARAHARTWSCPTPCCRSPRPSASAGGVDLRLLQLAAVVDVDGLPLGEDVEGRLAGFAVAVAGVLRAAER